MFETRRVDTTHFLRAIGIALVVLNHSVRSGFHGGLNILLLMSGISFAALAFDTSQKPMLRVSWEFARKLFLGTVLLTLVWFILRGDFSVAELFVVSNWLGAKNISLFPARYTQVVVQILFVVVLLFSVPGLRALAVRRPVVVSFCVLAVTVASATVSKLTVDTLPLSDKLPHLFAWNFVLGWVFWAVLERRQPKAADRLALAALVVALAILMFPILQVKGWEARMWLFTLPVLLLVWRPTVRLPFVVAHPILLTSQATLVIFFVHLPLKEVAGPALRWLFGDVWRVVTLGKFSIAMLGSIAMWMAITAFVRVWRRRKFSPGLSNLPSHEANVLSGAGVGAGAPAPAR